MDVILQVEQQSPPTLVIDVPSTTVIEVFQGLRGPAGAPGSGSGDVSSVNGETGAVFLSAADVGALPSSYVPTWASITGKPSTFAPASHTHVISEVTALQASLDGKAAIAHNHVRADITDFAHTHIIGDTTGLQAALDLKAPLASPTFTGTVAGITKAMVGLTNVDNTADTAKPVSTAQQTALDLKANLASPTFTGTVSGITKTMVGLANVDNTTDLNKPISTATQTALDLKAPIASPTFTGTVSGITKTHVGLGNVANVDQQNAANLTSGTVPTARLGSGTASSSTFLRGDNTWQVVSGGSSNLDGLTDVIITTPATAQVIRYNGTNWVNAALVQSDITGLTTVLTEKADAIHNHSASAITSGTFTLALLPAGATITVDKVKNGGAWPARPTSRTDVTVVWTGNTDPGAAAIDGDKWDVTP